MKFTAQQFLAEANHHANELAEMLEDAAGMALLLEQNASRAGVPDGWEILPEDLRTHLGDWERAVSMAAEVAQNKRDWDDLEYWKHQFLTLRNIRSMVSAAPSDGAE